MIQLLHGDCLVEMSALPDASADLILCDLPYGTTACKWDTVIPFEPLWAHYKRVIKPKGAIVLFGSQPFTSALVMSNPEWFKYEWAWDKDGSTCFVHAKHRPLGQHENILVFGKGATTYNPQKTPGKPYSRGRIDNSKVQTCPTKKDKIFIHENPDGLRYPRTILRFSNKARLNQLHPTQKPVALLEYLIKTYTNQGETVLDNCFGSGSCGVACINTGRSFIGIEKDTDYFAVGSQRIKDAQAQPALLAA